ncbi:MAG: hypothetical protein IKG81_11725 [Bacteroidales bacterium]|nr:hypothetical protein [Bacteroidales bacterium]
MTKRIHTTMIVGLMAGIVMLAGCKREYGTVTLGANIDNVRDAKVYIDDLTPCWHNNDLIRVNNQTCTTSAALGSSAQITDVVESNHYRAIYPADIVGDVEISNSSTIAVTLPREQLYEVDSRGDQKVKVPMGAYSSSESLTFHNLCSLIKVVVTNRMESDFDLGCITVEAGSAYLSGPGSATVEGRSSDAVELTASSSASHEVSLVFPTGNRPTIGREDRDSYVYYIVAPEFVEDDVTITLTSANGHSVTFEKRASLRHNRMALVGLTVERWDEVGPVDPDWVDLGLPSGLLWATRNVGATSPEDYGDYFAWGETVTKSVYAWYTYIYGGGSYSLTKYCSIPSMGYNGFTDNLTILQPDDDAATANYGGRTPTKEEWQELMNNTTSSWTTQNGVNGRLFIRNGNSLFLPAAGCRLGSSLSADGSSGYYWSSSLDANGPDYAWYFGFGSGSQRMDYYDRFRGYAVRAVRQN